MGVCGWINLNVCRWWCGCGCVWVGVEEDLRGLLWVFKWVGTQMFDASGLALMLHTFIWIIQFNSNSNSIPKTLFVPNGQLKTDT